MSTPTELLRRHRPFLKYDSQETYFADSAAEWTDNPGNRLLNEDGDELAAAGSGLSLAFLGDHYPDGSRPQRRRDCISDPTKQVRRPGARAAREEALRQPRLRPRGRATATATVAAVLVLLLLQRLQPDRAVHPRRAARGRLGDDPDPPRGRAARPRGLRAAHAWPRRATGGRSTSCQARSGRSSTSRAARTRRYFEPGTQWTGALVRPRRRQAPQPRARRSRSSTRHDRSSAGCAGPGTGATRRAGGSPLDSDSPTGPGRAPAMGRPAEA